MKGWIAASAVLLLTVGCTSSPVEPFDCEQQLAELSGIVKVKNAVPDRFIVVMQPAGATPSSLAPSGYETWASSEGARDVRVYDAALGCFGATMDRAGARAMARDPRVAFVQQVGTKRVDPRTAPDARATWGIDRIDQRGLPLNGEYQPPNDGTGIHAYIIDTGVDTDHAEFTGRVGEGFSAFDDSFGSGDDHGHGTHVAGTVGGTTYGAAKAVIVHPVRVLQNGSGTDEDVIRGVDWVTAHVQANGWPAVANMSLGGDASPALDLALCRSMEAGVALAVAAGNDGFSACDQSPARVVQAVTTAATDRLDTRPDWSNRGPCVDVFAPGVDVESARRGSGNGSTTLSGTSMASPHVAGALALCSERLPGAGAAQLKACIIEHATPGRVRNSGSGSPNLMLYVGEDLPE